MDFYVNEITENIEVAIALGLATLCFVTYWFIAHSKGIISFFTKDESHERAEVKRVVFQKMTGVFFLGLVPAVVCYTLLEYPHTAYGLNFYNFSDSVFNTVIISLIVVPLSFFTAGNKHTQAVYPQMRIEGWTVVLVIVNSICWLLYLFAYEFLFRGVLFLLTYPKLGVVPAMAISTAFYSCTHIPKGLKETLLAIPFGIVLCVTTYRTTSLVAATVAHVLLALGNDFGAVFHSKTRRFVFGKR